MFRRRSAPTAEAPSPEDTAATGRPGATAGKGRPTPKRNEAERRRRQPYTAPTDRKAAARQTRARDREERGRKAEAMKRGEDWALPARDKGPVKALARDYVDSRIRLSEFYMYGLIVLLVMLFVPSAIVQSIIPVIIMILVVVMLLEGAFLGFQTRKLVKSRYPDESARGVSMYAAMRALQIRRLRMPKPRIKPGDNF